MAPEPTAVVAQKELLLLRKLERAMSAHFITPHMKEHLELAHATLVELFEWRKANS